MSGTTAIEKHEPAQAIVTFSPERLDLLRRTICAEASPDELDLFVERCRATGLDPFVGQIHLVKRKGSPAKTQTGIDGFRLIAERTGQRDGEDPPLWCGADGKWLPIWTSAKPPAACQATVYRRGHSRGYVGLAYWSMYAQTKRDGGLNSMWQRGGPNMLAKCAEALALRKAFPNELCSLYTDDEMQQADAAAEPTTIGAAAVAIGQELIETRSEEEMLAFTDRIKALGSSDKEAVRKIYRMRREVLRQNAPALSSGASE